jgi:hypothetical protein
VGKIKDGKKLGEARREMANKKSKARKGKPVSQK